MNRRKVKGTNVKNNGKPESSKLINGKDLERNLRLEVAKDLSENNKKDRK